MELTEVTIEPTRLYEFQSQLVQSTRDLDEHASPDYYFIINGRLSFNWVLSYALLNHTRLQSPGELSAGDEATEDWIVFRKRNYNTRTFSYVVAIIVHPTPGNTNPPFIVQAMMTEPWAKSSLVETDGIAGHFALLGYHV